MWKLTLLHVFVALLPLFVLQIWYNRTSDDKNSHCQIALINNISMIIGFAVSSNGDFPDSGLDFRFVPFLLGSLYGGYVAMASLSITYAICLFVLNGPGFGLLFELAGLAAFVLPLLIKVIPSCRNAERKRMLSIALRMMLVILAVQLITEEAQRILEGRAPSAVHYGYFFVHAVLYCIVILLAVYLAENDRKNQRQHYELKLLANWYRIEDQKLQQFIDQTPFAVIFTDQNGFITHINEMAVQLLKIEPPAHERQRLIGLALTSIESWKRNHILTKTLDKALDGETIGYQYVQEQGKTVMQTGISLRDMQTGEITGAAIIAQDVTEVALLRDEVGRMERLSLVGQMAASITHEIRNPLAVIRGFVQLMRERTPDHQKEYFRIVMDELDRANSIINDFLSLAQNRVIEKENFSLHDILHDMLPLLWADANMRGLSISLDLAKQMPKLMLNVKEMKQLILNLARNGMEAMEQKGELRLRTVVTADKIELHVSDMGCGIPKEKLDRLFEPFYTTKTRGTGLGLPLCLSIVERHAGQIRVETTEGIGTTFIVSFDRKVSG